MSLLVPGNSGIAAANTQQLLFLLRNANMQQAGDQQFTRVFSGNNYGMGASLARSRSGTPSILTAGGIYDQPNKGGNALVIGTQLWTGAGVGLVLNISVGNLLQGTLLANTPYLNLTTTSLTAATIDVYIWGYDLT